MFSYFGFIRADLFSKLTNFKATKETSVSSVMLFLDDLSLEEQAMHFDMKREKTKLIFK